jgi:nucleoside-diphosphate-sugar epimerase
MIDLVTGATGFIGSHLAQRLLREGRSVRVLCRGGSESKLPPDVGSGADIVLGDLNDRTSLRLATAGIARVFHCAGHVLDWGSESDFMTTNVRGTKWLLEGAKAACVSSVVHFSSIAVFGTPLPPWFDDDSPYGPGRDLYSRAKIDAENVALAFRDQGLRVAILRPAVVYGPRGRWLEDPLAMIEKGKMFLLGDGLGTCHPCYIENLLDATLLAAVHPRGVNGSFIVGDDDPISFRTYFDAVASLAGRPPVRRSVPVPVARAMAWTLELGARAVHSKQRPLLTRIAVEMLTTTSEMSMKRIKSELGYAPRYDFASAMSELRQRYAALRASAVSPAPPPP